MNINRILQQDGVIYESTIDRNAQEVPTAAYEEKIRFRHITELDKGSYYEGMTSADAIIWLAPDTHAVEGCVIKADNKYWRTDKFVKARRLTGSTIFFIKALVKPFKATKEFESFVS